MTVSWPLGTPSKVFLHVPRQANSAIVKGDLQHVNQSLANRLLLPTEETKFSIAPQAD